MLKSKGYLMIDLSIAVALFSILSLGIISIYDSYINFKSENDLKLESVELFHAITMEIKHNITFEQLDSLEVNKEYYVMANDIRGIIDNPIINLFNINKLKNEDNLCTVRVLPKDSDNAMDIEVEILKDDGIFIYENKEIIRKYSFIR